jgi:anti-sigma B factor antagonist
VSDTAPLRLTSSRPTATCGVLHVDGEVDLLTTPSLSTEISKQLADRTAQTVVLDLSGVTFFGSSGLATLIKAAETAAEQDIRLILVAANRAVLRPLEVTTTAGLFTIYATVEAAVAAL